MTCRALSRSQVLWYTRPGVLRCWFVASFCSLLFAGLPNVLQAQEVDLKPRQEVLTTKDVPGISLAITYWPSKLKQDGGVVVLLHGHKGNQLDWGKSLPDLLQKEGYAVIAVDLRGHGQSKTAGGSDETVETTSKKKTKPKASKDKEVDANNLRAIDYENMVAYDMEAVKAFIYAENQDKKLNMNKMAIIGAGMGAAVGLRYAAVDWLKPPHSDGPEGAETPRGQDVRALVLLTPDPDVSRLSLPPAIDTLRLPLRQVAMLFAVGKSDRLDKGATKRLFEQAATPENENNNPTDSKKKRMYLIEYKTPARGTGLLVKNPQIETNLINFLKKHVQDVKSEWRDRQSKVGRKKA